MKERSDIAGGGHVFEGGIEYRQMVAEKGDAADEEGELGCAAKLCCGGGLPRSCAAQAVCPARGHHQRGFARAIVAPAKGQWYSTKCQGHHQQGHYQQAVYPVSAPLLRSNTLTGGSPVGGLPRSGRYQGGTTKRQPRRGFATASAAHGGTTNRDTTMGLFGGVFVNNERGEARSWRIPLGGVSTVASPFVDDRGHRGEVGFEFL